MAVDNLLGYVARCGGVGAKNILFNQNVVEGLACLARSSLGWSQM